MSPAHFIRDVLLGPFLLLEAIFEKKGICSLAQAVQKAKLCSAVKESGSGSGFGT